MTKWNWTGFLQSSISLTYSPFSLLQILSSDFVEIHMFTLKNKFNCTSKRCFRAPELRQQKIVAVCVVKLRKQSKAAVLKKNSFISPGWAAQSTKHEPPWLKETNAFYLEISDPWCALILAGFSQQVRLWLWLYWWLETKDILLKQLWHVNY